MNNYHLQKNIVNYQLNSLKNRTVDPNNIVLNAAAFQDQISQKFGICPMKFKKQINYKFTIRTKARPKTNNKTTQSQQSKPDEKSNMINELYAKKVAAVGNN